MGLESGSSGIEIKRIMGHFPQNHKRLIAINELLHEFYDWVHKIMV